MKVILISLIFSWVPNETHAASCSKIKKVTHYFGGTSKTSIEGAPGYGNRSNFLIPCFSVACPDKYWLKRKKKLNKPGYIAYKKGQRVAIPALKGVKCFEKATAKGKLGQYKKHFSNSKYNIHVKCQDGVCTNQSGIFECADSGSAVLKNGHFDLYLGDCDGEKSHTCKEKIDGSTIEKQMSELTGSEKAMGSCFNKVSPHHSGSTTVEASGSNIR